jgi:signal peptidase
VFVVPGVGRVRSGLAGAAHAAAERLGVGAPEASELGYLVAAAAAALYVRDVVADRGRRVDRSTERSVGRDEGVDPRLAVGVFAFVVVVGATAAMLGPAGTQRYGVVSAEFDSDRPLVVRAGETATVSHTLTNAGVPAVVYVEPVGDGVTVTPRRTTLGVVDRTTVSVGLSAPPETGYYRRYVVEHRYLLVLPPPVVDALHRVHPLVATAAVDLTVGVGFYLVGRLLVPSRSARPRRLDRDGP